MILEFDLQRNRTTVVAVTLAAAVVLMAPTLQARPKYAKASGQKCATCHFQAKGGGALRPIGKAFSKNHRVWPEDRSRWNSWGTTGKQHCRFIVGLFHGLATLIWIIAVVMMLPALGGARKPDAGKTALQAATFAISVLIASGVVLTLLRFSDLELLPLMRTGRVVLLKIVLSAGLLLAIVFRVHENDNGSGEAAVPTKVQVFSHRGAATLIAAMTVFMM